MNQPTTPIIQSQPQLPSDIVQNLPQPHSLISNFHSQNQDHERVSNCAYTSPQKQQQKSEQNGENRQKQGNEDILRGEQKDEGKMEKEKRSENQEGKNLKNQSSEQIKESRENETSQLPVAASKKCFNKLCSVKKIYRKLRSRVEAGKYRFLCRNCYENYNSNFFCEFCEQIYSNQYDDEDMNKWIGCDSCERWNHIDCEKRHRFKSIDLDQNLKYECLSCSRKSRNFEEVPKKKVEKDDTAIKQKPKIQIKKEDRIPIFHKKPSTFPNLEPFLQTYNFKLWINDALIRDDLDNLRSLLDRPQTEQESKKSKKVKLE